MLGTVVPLALLLRLAPSLAAAARRRRAVVRLPHGARTARELATCADARIAAADRELAAWQHGCDPATVKALRADQKKFLEDLDSGFEGEVWGKQSRRGKVARADRAPAPRRRLRCAGDLEAQLRERLAFLRDPTPATSYAGLGRTTISLWVAADGGEAHYRATFGMTTFGCGKYHCHFTAAFAAADKGFAAMAAHNTDPEVDEDTASRLSMTRSGAILVLTEEIRQCGRGEAPAHLPARRRLCRSAVSHRPRP